MQNEVFRPGIFDEDHVNNCVSFSFCCASDGALHAESRVISELGEEHFVKCTEVRHIPASASPQKNVNYIRTV